jgi:hypothetical protein
MSQIQTQSQNVARSDEHTNQQRRNDPHEDMNTVQKE